VIGLGDRLVSCLMVTQASRWRDGAPVGIESFKAQTYEARELVLVTADPCEEMEAAGFDVNVCPRGSTLGQLRQHALELASGEWVATWDDDDLSAPTRIAEQLEAVEAVPLADACLLLRVRIRDDVHEGITFTGPRHSWEMTMLARREVLPRYRAELVVGEDSEVIGRLRQIVLLDRPDLYLHIAHRGATVAGKWVNEWWEARTAEGGAP
jgi:glycosyltransferase involved in cell wall biosynthesis